MPRPGSYLRLRVRGPRGAALAHTRSHGLRGVNILALRRILILLHSSSGNSHDIFISALCSRSHLLVRHQSTTAFVHVISTLSRSFFGQPTAKHRPVIWSSRTVAGQLCAIITPRQQSRIGYLCCAATHRCTELYLKMLRERSWKPPSYNCGWRAQAPLSLTTVFQLQVPTFNGFPSYPRELSLPILRFLSRYVA